MWILLLFRVLYEGVPCFRKPPRAAATGVSAPGAVDAVQDAPLSAQAVAG